MVTMQFLYFLQQQQYPTISNSNSPAFIFSMSLYYCSGESISLRISWVLVVCCWEGIIFIFLRTDFNDRIRRYKGEKICQKPDDHDPAIIAQVTFNDSRFQKWYLPWQIFSQDLAHDSKPILFTA